MQKRIYRRNKVTVMTAAIIILILTPVLNVVLAQDASVPRLRILWSRPTKPPVSSAMTPDGKFFCILSDKGVLSYYTGDGSLLWRKTFDAATAVTMSDNGKIIMAYATLNPAHRRISIITADGRVRWSQELAGCIWSAAVSRDGSTAAIGTGDSRVYLYSLGRRLKYRRRALPGIPLSMQFDPTGQRLLIGMWQDSGVGMYGLDGKEIWRAKGMLNLGYTAATSSNGAFVLSRADPNRPRPDVTLALWTAAGRRLWQKRLDVDDVRTGLSLDGSLVAASYRERIERPGKSFEERRLVLLDRGGISVWERGGMFSKPELVFMLPGDRILVSSENTILYLLDPRGKTISKLKLPAAIRRYTTAQPAGRALLYCGDGYIYMLVVGSGENTD